MIKRYIYLGISLLFVFSACRKRPQNNSRYMETLTYNDDASTYQREWYLSTNKNTDAISALHIEVLPGTIVGNRPYWMTIAMEKDKANNNVAAYIYDNEIGVLNGKYTLLRLYNYIGEKYLEHNQINFKGTFEETIIYFDIDSIIPNDTTMRKGTFVMEYQGRNNN